MTSGIKNGDAGDGALGFVHHDHSECVGDALAVAEERCKTEGLRFTPVRRKVLEILLEQHRALGAYAILDRLRKDGFGSAPPIAYRALDFLQEYRLVHKIERLNAFIACVHPNESHAPAFMICRLCDAVAETHSATAQDTLSDAASATGFRIERTVIEAEGICPACVDKADA